VGMIYVDHGFVEFDRVYWRLYAEGRDDKPLFEYTAANSQMFYQPVFAEAVGLPADRFPVDHVYTVLVGYHEQSGRWLLGVHCSLDPNATPLFKVLARWTSDNNQAHALTVEQAASGLAKLLGCPLKVFGARKLPVETNDDKRSGLTGPLTPHLRQRVDLPNIEDRVNHIELPIEGDSFILFRGRNGLVLKQGKPASGGDIETPIYNMCEFNAKLQFLRLVPPTGLLGTFTESSAQRVLFDQILNVELRCVEDEGRMFWGIYLTVPSESLLLAQSLGSKDGDAAEKITEAAAHVIAYAVRCHLVKTRLDLSDSAVQGG
jgi:hypothetical protein